MLAEARTDANGSFRLDIQDHRGPTRHITVKAIMHDFTVDTPGGGLPSLLLKCGGSNDGPVVFESNGSPREFSAGSLCFVEAMRVPGTETIRVRLAERQDPRFKRVDFRPLMQFLATGQF
jgi:hypothetical protein